MICVGFYKQDLADALTENYTILQERIETVAMWLEEEGSDNAALWMVLDFMDFDLATVRALQIAASERVQLPMEHIHILTTHNHGGGAPNVEKMAALCGECAAKAKENACPAYMRYAFVQADQQMSFIRRKYVPELERKITIYYGPSQDDGYNAAPFIEHAVQTTRNGQLKYVGRAETDRPVDPFAPADPEIMILQFQQPDGTHVGSVLRFAAHVNCATVPECFTSDFPWHVRQRLETQFGGTALFFNGPCGDISPGMGAKGDGSHEILGEYLVSKALQAVETAAFEPVRRFADTTVRIPLPVRKEVKENRVEMLETMPEQLPERRRYLEKEYLVKFLSFLREKAAENGGVQDSVTIELGLLKLNGLTLAGFPGETFSTTAQAVKAAFPERDICTLTEHDRTVMYLPPVEEFALGGYESVCMSTAPGAEDILREQAISAVKQFCVQ